MVIIAILNNLDKSKVFIYLIIALPILMLIINGCSEKITEEMNSDKNPAITGHAATEILRACKYPSEKFCEEKCCQTEEKCKNDFAYMECDLKTGQWVNETYSDFNCLSKCKISAEGISDYPIQENLPACEEGWKCISKFERSYRLSNCSFTLAERCDRGCMNDSCINLCNPGDFSCRSDVLMECNEDGNLWLYHNICEYGCENGQCLDSTSQNQTNSTQPQQNICDDKCISILDFNYNAEGNDCQTPNGEYVIFKNSCSFSCDMTGWNMSDDSIHSYRFQSYELESGAIFSLYSGSGTNTATKLYWNKYSPCIWNDDGDTLYLRNSNKELILSYTYP
ncbi:lamin tail domain-containing protein [Candidatus Woesearchaeota archaeon]|nr:lamin tail domain-containing protein [Candidatus Woesearchaeota archaeon]